jgi:uncharacterized phage protein (TIGR02218 family)
MKNFSPLGITRATVGFPARLCVITRTDGTVYRIAESDTAITVSGDTFQVVPGIQISAVKHTSNGEMPSCQIVAVHGSNATINSQDLDVGLFDGATVQLYVVDRLNLSRKGLLFSGSIANISYTTENQVSFDVKGPAVSAKILMTQKRSPMCRTDLFSVLCGINPASWAATGTIATIVNAFNFTVSGLSIAPPADGYFNQGVAVTSAGTAFELSNWVQSTATITAYLPCNRILTVGGSLTLYPGCDKTLGANGCPKFSNQLNFQGEPHFLGAAAAAQQV